jgi:N-acetylmuramoyl-L-alanine amidase
MMKKALLPLLASFIITPVAFAGSVVESLRLWSAPDHTRLVFDLNGEVDHHMFSLDNPSRIVIDLKNSSLKARLTQPTADDLFISKVRYSARNGNDFRIVLDLKQKATPKSFLLQPNSQYGHRLVVDLDGVAGSETTATNSEPAKTAIQTDSKSEVKVTKTVKTIEQGRDVVIAVDAGHGGEDPGALGPTGTREKEVVLEIAQKLADEINRKKGFKAVLTRKGDYYIGLRQRMKIARQHKADLFVSIHADAFNDSRVRGSSVYVLSSRGASNAAARWLADRENAADLVGGVKLEDKDDMLASVLLDLSQAATREASSVVADEVFDELKRHGKTHGKKVLKAGFVVLKSPDVPSMLIETAFISNPAEERNLKSDSYQRKLAKAIQKGIEDYFTKSPPPGTLLAQNSPKRHVIASGETLSEIAQQYNVSLSLLRQTNSIQGDRLLVGQVLTIPRS